MKILTVIIASILLLSSCGDGSSKRKHGKGSEKAEEICDCVKEVVDLSDVTAENFDREMNKVDRNPEKKKKLAKCMKSTILTMIDEMEDLEDKERKEYIKAFMKGGIDCDCMDIVMDNVVKEMPTYMDMIKSVVKEIDVDGSSDRVV